MKFGNIWALLCTLIKNEFGPAIGAFFTTIYEFYGGYYWVSTPASVDTILYDIKREYE